MFDLGVVESLLTVVMLFVFGGAMGWHLRAAVRDPSLEVRSQAADIDWLRAALADSEKRCAQQGEWLANIEEELVASRPDDANPA
jgi:hypothetical protein